MKNHKVSPNTAKTQIQKVEKNARWLAQYITKKMTAENMIGEKAKELFQRLEYNGSVDILLSMAPALQKNKNEKSGIEPYIASTYNFTQKAIELNSDGQKNDGALKEEIKKDCVTMIQAVWDMKNEFEMQE